MCVFAVLMNYMNTTNCMYVPTYILACMYVCMYVCMYIYVNMILEQQMYVCMYCMYDLRMQKK